MVVLLREQSVSDCRHLSHVGAALFSAGVSLLIATNTDCISQTCHVEGCRQLGSYAVVDAKSPLHSLTLLDQFSMSANACFQQLHSWLSGSETLTFVSLFASLDPCPLPY